MVNRKGAGTSIGGICPPKRGHYKIGRVVGVRNSYPFRDERIFLTRSSTLRCRHAKISLAAASREREREELIHSAP